MVSRGTLNIVDRRGTIVAKRINGEFVGEQSLLHGTPAGADVLTKDVRRRASKQLPRASLPLPHPRECESRR